MLNICSGNGSHRGTAPPATSACTTSAWPRRDAVYSGVAPVSVLAWF
eukprot:CAMPEP_0118967686 /NCGR_PEP_ID=MMETSP1173-20130426/5040_1 /TAXON_ID=1034831 /ORGANISM="Rhizochromulina marina cf, Strain CCMP1243" /LENGTH=46 /DNA_ID= /DNA_START= /DNA_END= /DNA_ORIENTATION=